MNIRRNTFKASSEELPEQSVLPTKERMHGVKNGEGQVGLEDTLPKLLLMNYKKYGDKRIAMRNKEFGIWKNYTWEECYQRVKYFSLGLKSLGLNTKDVAAIIGDNEPEWFWAEYAAQAMHGIALGIFTDSAPSEIKHILEHSEAKFVVARDQEMVDKILQIKNDLPALQKVIYWDTKGMQGYIDPSLSCFEDVMVLGKQYEDCHHCIFDAEVEKGRGDDIAVALYTSGTTGLPKGVMLTHNQLIANYRACNSFIEFSGKDEYLSYMAPAWVTEQVLGVTCAMASGAIIGFPEKPETAFADGRELGSRVILFSARLWEDLARSVKAKMAEASASKRFIYNLFLPVGYKINDLKFHRKKLSFFWKGINWLADLLVFRPLRDKLGVLKTRCAMTGGTMLSPDTFKFLHAIGLKLRQIYGITEAGGVITLQREDDTRDDTIGPPAAGIEVRVDEQGELLVRGPQVFFGYHKDPETTKKALTNGWFHTGDGVHISEGHVVFLDRMSELLELADGIKYAPQYIEGRLKFSPYIKDAMIVGGTDKPFVSAIISIDFGNVGKWAEKRHVTYTTYVDLSQKPEVYDLIKKEVEKVNKNLPPAARVKKLLHLHKEFDPDEAELTRTRKLRRRFMEERYKDLIQGLYSGREVLTAEAVVKYRDGKEGVIRTPIRVIKVA